VSSHSTSMPRRRNVRRRPKRSRKPPCVTFEYSGCTSTPILYPRRLCEYSDCSANSIPNPIPNPNSNPNPMQPVDAPTASAALCAAVAWLLALLYGLLRTALMLVGRRGPTP
jgi:hypothetical protein